MSLRHALALISLTLTVTAVPPPSLAAQGAVPARAALLAAGQNPGSTRGSEAVERLKAEGHYESLRDAVRQARYVVRSPGSTATTGEAGGFEVANPSQGLRARFAAGGIEVVPAATGAAGWRWGMRLLAYGYGERLDTPAEAVVSASGNRLEYRYGQGLTEWYVNTPSGIEQGFTLARPPVGTRQGRPLELVLAVSGGLVARPVAGDGALQFVAADGKAVLGYRDLHAWDARGRALPARLALAPGQVRLVVDDSAAAYPVTIDPLVYSETKLTPSDGGADDDFGWAVAISGNTAVVGAPFHQTSPGIFAGQVYVFVRSGTTWSEQAKLTASDGASSDGFGSAVAVSGHTAVIGAPEHDPGSKPGAGQAYVFARSGTTWSEQAKLTASDGAAGDAFGFAVAISGSTVVVGAPLVHPNFTAGPGAGQAYVFARSGTTWSQQAKLTASDGAGEDALGFAVGLDGNTAIVGAPGAHSLAGQAYAYVRSGTTWSEKAKLTASDGAAGDQFGAAVGVSGNTAVVGAPVRNIGAASAAGQVYVFARSGTKWSQQRKLAASDTAEFRFFGFSVATHGDSIVVGAPFHSMVGPDTGLAYVFGPTSFFAAAWVGLQNSDDVGLRLDLQAQFFIGGNKVAEGQLSDVSAGSSGFDRANLQGIPLNLTGASPGPALSLSVVVGVRLSCADTGHSSGIPRLWYNGQPIDSGASRDAGSRIEVGLDAPFPPLRGFLRSSFALSFFPGSSRLSIDKPVDDNIACPGRPFTPFGSWSVGQQ
jgi:hypothetical protein